MEEARDGRCGVVYYNPGDEDTSELFTRDSLPAGATEKHVGEKLSRAHVNHDIRTLLDVDQGGFHEGESMRLSVQLVFDILICSSISKFTFQGLHVTAREVR